MEVGSLMIEDVVVVLKIPNYVLIDFDDGG